MTSLRIEAITRDIAQARLPISAAILRVERSMLNAQLGDFEAAENEIEAVREISKGRDNATLSAWLNLAEGLVHFYRGDRISSRGKIERAAVLASISEDKSIMAHSLAWRAQLDLDFDDLQRMIKSIAASLAVCEEGNDWAKSRLYSILGICYGYSGEPARSREWFVRARESAIRRGDDLMQGALIWNIVSTTADVFRVDELYVQGWSEDLRRLWLFNESSINFDHALGAVAFWWLPKQIRAELLAREGNFIEALAIYKEIEDVYVSNKAVARESVFRADIAWCLGNLGRHAESLEEARLSESSLHLLTHWDDKAAAYGRLARVFGLLGVVDSTDKYRVLGKEAWDSLCGERKLLSGQLVAIAGSISSR